MTFKVLPVVRRQNYYGFSIGADKALIICARVAKNEKITASHYQLLVDDNRIGIKFLKKEKGEEAARQIRRYGNARSHNPLGMPATTALSYHGIFKIKKTVHFPFKKDEDGIYFVDVADFKARFAEHLEIREEEAMKCF